jgi:HK97 family phage prohead protease
MTEQYQTTSAGELAIRAQADESDGRTIEGLAVPYGVPVSSPTAEYGELREMFAPGSFREAIAARNGQPVAILDSHHGTVVGSAELREASDGLRFAGRLLTSSAARDYAERVEAGISGVSIEFLPGRVTRSRGGITHTAVRAIGAIAGAYAPAYTAAGAAIREANAMDTTETTAATETTEAQPAAIRAAVAQATNAAVAELGRELRESIVAMRAQPTADGWSDLRRSFGELARAEATGDPTARGWMARALADADTVSSPGVTTPGVVGEVRGIFTRGRPAIDAWGRSQLDGVGMSVDWPYLAAGTNWATIIGEQTTEKSEITSIEVPILKGSSPIKTYAGGSDVSYQLIRRSSPSYLEAYARILAIAYGNVTEAAFVNIIEGTSGILDGAPIDWATATAAAIVEGLFLASTQVADATGAPAAFVLASATPYAAIAGAVGALPVPVTPAAVNAATLQLNVAGLPIYYSPAVNANTVLVSNGLTAEWHEDGPMYATEEDVAKLGRNMAIWGMGAAEVAIPSGIVQIANA